MSSIITFINIFGLPYDVLDYRMGLKNKIMKTYKKYQTRRMKFPKSIIILQNNLHSSRTFVNVVIKHTFSIFDVPEVELDKAGDGVEGGADTADHVEAQVQRLQRRQVLNKTRVNQGMPYHASIKNLLSRFFPSQKI